MRDPETQADIDSLFGYRPDRHGYSPAPYSDRRSVERDEYDTADGLDAEDLPSADDLGGQQHEAAKARLHLDVRKYPSFGWTALDAVVGQTIPGDLVIVAAPPGSGKSLFLRNWWDDLICRQQKHGTYLGLEDSPEHCRIKWACDRTGIPAKLALASGDAYGTPVHVEAMRIIERELEHQRTSDIKWLHHFATTRHVTTEVLKQWIHWSHDQGATFVMVDHIDRVDVGPGANSQAEMARAVIEAKELGEALKMVVILASQVKRPMDRVLSLAPPSMEDMAGSSSKERESSIILAIWRMLRPDIQDDEIKAVRMGQADITSLWLPGAMGVRVLKHRIDGEGFGKQVRLRVRGSKVIDWAEEMVPIRTCWRCPAILHASDWKGWGLCADCYQEITT